MKRPAEASNNAPSIASRTQGASGEDAAASLLRSLGYRIVARNLRTRFAEIDILARRRRLYVAVEVKTRRHHPAPERAVTPKQIERISTAVRKLAPHLRPRPKRMRIDIIAVTPARPPDASMPEIRHFPGAEQSFD